MNIFLHVLKKNVDAMFRRIWQIWLWLSNFQLDASDFVYVNYDMCITTSLMFYLPQDLTSPHEIFPTFHETKYLHKNVCLKFFTNMREKYLAHAWRSFSFGRKKSWESKGKWHRFWKKHAMFEKVFWTHSKC